MQKYLVVSKKSITFAPNLKFNTIAIRFKTQINRTNNTYLQTTKIMTLWKKFI